MFTHLQKGNLVIEWEEWEARDSLGKLDDPSNGRGEPLAKIFEDPVASILHLLGHRVERTGLELRRTWGEDRLCPCLLHEKGYLVLSVVTGFIMSSKQGREELILVIQLFTELFVSRIHVDPLHGCQDLGLLSLRDPTKSHGIPTHPYSDTLFEPTVLTAVSIDSEDGTLLVLRTRSVLDLLLDTSSEEPLLKTHQSRKQEKRRVSVRSEWQEFQG